MKKAGSLIVHGWVLARSSCHIGRGVDRFRGCGLAVLAKLFLVPCLLVGAIVLYAIASRFVRGAAVWLGARSLDRCLTLPTTLEALERDAPAARLARMCSQGSP